MARYESSAGLNASIQPPSLSATSRMAHYENIAGPNGPAIDATFDISSTVFATLSTASEFAPLPFLQQASFLALAILNTVRGAKDNKESFKALANDACELVSAIICVYKDMEMDGLTPSSLGLKKHVDDLISLLQAINQFAQKHVAKSALHRMIRLQTEMGKIQMYRVRLKQALDVFGLQSSISIHETVVQILKELREREPPPQTKKDWESEGNITGNISINNIAGNQEIHSTRHYTTIVDSFNNREFSSRSQSWDGGKRRNQ
ncbi:hypothetical protein B0H19DRAFT_19912 [Mycena capillaripes]|nr:hypothetical protein B0H19DRAFT_19912 [Mycena capillaripes]